MKKLIILLILVALLLPLVGCGSNQFVGSVNSDVYHYPSCRYVDEINEGNKVWFTSSQDARSHGYRPCKVCQPP
ncbi:MAG: hypothetical protein HQ588_00870 [Deltaproteobacteria bacterium]|nr:hypothetical protein [Deltaproteobacteria bacterium]